MSPGDKWKARDENKTPGLVGDGQSGVTEPEQTILYPRTRRGWRCSSTRSPREKTNLQYESAAYFDDIFAIK